MHAPFVQEVFTTTAFYNSELVGHRNTNTTNEEKLDEWNYGGVEMKGAWTTPPPLDLSSVRTIDDTILACC